MTKTLKQRLDDLEKGPGELPVMVFEQTWDNEDLFYLAGKNYNIMQKSEVVDKRDLMTRDQALAKAGDKYRPLFITYVKDWRGVDNA
jgi:hypothetical protein